MNGGRHGNGKRWLLIALVVLGGFWLVNDAYRDGYYDALVQTGQISRARDYYSGPHFPWGLLIIGGIAYIAWRKGAFDRFTGPGGGPSNFPSIGPAMRGPRAIFDEWHREAHAAQRNMTAHQPGTPTAQAPFASPTPPTPPAPTPGAGNGHGVPAAPSTPAPTPPGPEYWAAMHQSSEAPSASSTPAPTSTPADTGQGAPGTQSERDGGTAGPVLERW